MPNSGSIDDRYATVFSGNWDGTSLTAVGSSSAPNREWGITFDSPCMAAYFKTVIDFDRDIASLPSGFTQSCSGYDACGDCDSPTPVSARCDPGPTFDAGGVCGGEGGGGGGDGGGGGSSSSATTVVVTMGVYVGLLLISLSEFI